MKKIYVFSIVIIIMIGFVVISNATSTSSNPIISLSYLNKTIDELKLEIYKEVDKRISESPTSGTGASAFKIINVEKGKKVICYESTEFVLRRGTASIIDPSKATNPTAPNGVPNLTVGKDAQHGDTVTLQQLYLVPRKDGRGIEAKTELTIMIKGGYEIQ